MSEGTDFIDTVIDEFDPEYLAAKEAKVEDLTSEEDELVRQAIQRRKAAYTAVFTEGPRTQSDIDVVLNDLARFCRAFSPRFDMRDGIHAETLMKIKEGRCEVYQRIVDQTRLDTDTLFIKYTDALYK
jgi:hypothetical protein